MARRAQRTQGQTIIEYMLLMGFLALLGIGLLDRVATDDEGRSVTTTAAR